MAIRTTKYYFSDIDTITSPSTVGCEVIGKPKITVINDGCFEVADRYKPAKVVIHNFANNGKQGGPCSIFTTEGKFISNQPWANTQEDQLIKRYTENIILPADMYPICKDNIPGNEALLYSQCGVGLCDVVTIAALQNPNYINASQRQTMINRIKLILAVCARHKKKLITGLWGCGAFGGNPQDLAELWRAALSDASLPKPTEIIFAIRIDSASSKWGSFADMEKLFSSIIVQ